MHQNLFIPLQRFSEVNVVLATLSSAEAVEQYRRKPRKKKKADPRRLRATRALCSVLHTAASQHHARR